MLVVAYLSTAFIIWNFDLSVLTNKERSIALSIYALVTGAIISFGKLEEIEIIGNIHDDAKL